ncbi:hypothetical protein IU438_04770 [Nocardia cyriacigeorgica]|uniref:hypothetical protein n=1 Tax=Nocardia cyriacigeorgica TaxID=135487 RepID=UPI0018934E7D|nr:hypothetical protein [Nocardia cyriacigeorgica]MBF6161356.1 hypothetical protein [Nocardia cyriacigeorgica]MBF6200219.1 hypothetical protein [Nocardia cyriacigeorgica]MBF6395096.1 hypothetical protein [Nocardia cyriacigeorgica]MBF6400729.1 hypothetical protein [Nocardia cyriacigeorgica]
MSALVGGEKPKDFVARVTSQPHKASPVGDQIDTALCGNACLSRQGEPMPSTPLWAAMPRIAEAVLHARAIPTTISDLKALKHSGLSWERSNLPERRILPEQNAGWSPGQLLAEWVNRDLRGRSAKARANERKHRSRLLKEELQRYDADLEAATTGPVIPGQVIVYSQASFFYTPPLHELDLPQWGIRAGDLWGEPTLVAWPVPPKSWSADRVARLATPRGGDCYWCGRPKAWYALKVTCGGTLRVFPACDRCQDSLSTEYGVQNLDWMLLWDDWDHRTGHPADQYR